MKQQIATTDKLKIDEEALFDLFIGDDKYRPQFHKPFLQDGYVVATNANMLIRVRKELLKGEYAENSHVPTVSKVFTDYNFDKAVTLEKLEAAIAQCPLEDEEILIREAVDCPDCDGDGEVEWEYTDKDLITHREYHECPVCHGSGTRRPAKYRKTGRKIPEYDAPIDVYGLNFRAMLLMTLCDAMKLLGLNQAQYVARHIGKANIFHLIDGVDVIIMPLSGMESVAKYE